MFLQVYDNLHNYALQALKIVGKF